MTDELNLFVDLFLEPPSPPGTPVVSEIETDSCQVNWMPPDRDGGARLAFYHLEKRANQKGSWIRATDFKLAVLESQLKTTYNVKVTHLVPDNVYEFRVAAENADNLVSDFSSSSQPVSTKVPFCTLLPHQSYFCFLAHPM